MSIISISQSMGDSTPEANPLSPAAKQRQLVVRAFAGTMAVGLVLTTLYLGTRIARSRSEVHPTAPVIKVAAPIATSSVTTPQLVKAPERVVSNMRKESPLVHRNVTPKPGEKY